MGIRICGAEYEAVIFDFDYTLADATEGIIGSFNYALEDSGYKIQNPGDIRKTVGMTLYDAFSLLTGIKDLRAADGFFKAFMSKADEIMTQNTSIYGDATPVLERLKDAGVKTGVVTNKMGYRVREVLEVNGIAHLIGCVVGYEDVEAHKPSPEGVRKAMELTGALPEETLYVGDSAVDAETASNAGIGFAGVTTGATSANELAAYPYVIIEENLAGIFL